MKECNFVCASCGVSGYKYPYLLKKSNNNFCNRLCLGKYKQNRVEKNCDYCKKLFSRKKSKISDTNNFCSVNCSQKFSIKWVSANCSFCNKLYEIKPDKYSRSLNHFCSKICSYKFKENKVEVLCLECGVLFKKHLCHVNRTDKNFCSKQCSYKYTNKTVFVDCLECGINFQKKSNDVLRYPRHFCSISCRNNLNKHKDWGSKRSKLEIAIEDHLKITFPMINVDYNKTDIGYELDIFIPCLNLAIEINGIFHYKAIHGEVDLLRRQQIDREKLVRCNELGINLIVLDVSKDGQGKKIRALRISEVEQIVRDKIRELDFNNMQMVMDI